MKISAKIKRRSVLIGILFTMLIIGIVYAADSYQVNSGAQVTIDEHSVCKKVTNNNALAIFVPTKIAAEWTAFRTHASGVTLGDCTYYCDEDNDGHYTETLVLCPSGRTSASAGDDCDDDCATCYPGSTSYTSSPDGKDQDCDGTIDEYTTTCSGAWSTTKVEFGVNTSCAILKGGSYKWCYTRCCTFSDTAAPTCTPSGTTCTNSNVHARNTCYRKPYGGKTVISGYAKCYIEGAVSPNFRGYTWHVASGPYTFFINECYYYICTPTVKYY